MLSDAGGAVARRRRDLRSLCKSLSTLWVLWSLFSSLIPPISFHHIFASPHFIVSESSGGNLECLPASHLCSSSWPFHWVLKLAKVEALASNRSETSKSEKCLLKPHGSMRSEAITGGLWRKILCSTTVDERFFASSMAKSTKSNGTLTLDPELIYTHASRSMESRSLAILVDQLYHQNSAMLEPVWKRAAEGLFIFHQAPHVRDPATIHHMINDSLRISPASTIQLPARYLSDPICNSPLNRLPRQSFIVSAKEKLGFSIVGLFHCSPLWFPLWPIYVSGRPKHTSTWPRFGILFRSSSFVLPCRHKINKGRGLLSCFMSTLEQSILDLYSNSPHTMAPCATLASADLHNIDLKGPFVSVSSFKKRAMLPTSSLLRERSIPPSSLLRERSFPPSSLLRERSIPPSSLLRERTFPPISLSLRGKLCSISNARDRSTSFTVLSSCVAVHTGPEDATALVSMRIGGKIVFFNVTS